MSNNTNTKSLTKVYVNKAKESIFASLKFALENRKFIKNI